MSSSRLLTKHRAGDIQGLDEVAQQCTLNPSNSPAAHLVTSGHRADPGTPDAWLEIGYRDQQSLGMTLQLHIGPGLACRTPTENIIFQSFR